MFKQNSEVVASNESDLNQAFIQHIKSIDRKSNDEPRLTCSEHLITSKSSLISNINGLKDFENPVEQLSADIEEQVAKEDVDQEIDEDSDSDSSEEDDEQIE